MPKISHHGIVTPDVSESGLVLHEWIYHYEQDKDYIDACLTHLINLVCVEQIGGREAQLKWKQLCQSKQI